MNQSAFNFDSELSNQARDRGINITCLNNKSYLSQARPIARNICKQKGWVTSDDVRKETERLGIEPKSSAAYGALFRSKEWRFTGQWIRSEYITNHSRMIRVWTCDTN